MAGKKRLDLLVFEAGFVQQVLNMRANGVRRYAQLLSDLFIDFFSLRNARHQAEICQSGWTETGKSNESL